MNLLTTLTACAMSGLVHIIAFIRLSTTDALDTRDFSILSASLLGLAREEQLIESGVEIGLQSFMLKHHKIISKYFFWESQTFLSFCLGEFASLKSLFAGSKSFFSYSLANYAFNSWIWTLLGSTSNMSSIYNINGQNTQSVVTEAYEGIKSLVQTPELSLNHTEICSTMQTKFSCSLTPSGWSIISFLLKNNLVDSGTHRWYPFTLLA